MSYLTGVGNFKKCEIVPDLLKNVTEFQAEVKKLLDPADEKETIPELEVLQKHLERGASFGIDLPEIVRLKTVSICRS